MREEGSLPASGAERLTGGDADGTTADRSAGTGGADAAGGPEGGETA